MEGDERPVKMRKLSHDHAATTTTTTVPEAREDPSPADIALEPSPLNQSKKTRSEGEPSIALAGQQYDLEEADLPSPDLGGATTPTNSAQTLSKNQLKKLRRKQEWEAGKAFRKAKKKEKTKEKRERKRTQREQEAQNGESTLSSHSKPKHHRAIRLPITFVIDCAFDDKMTEKERISLGSQITRAYSDNSRAPYQAHLVVCSWGGMLRERFETVLDGHYRNWKGVRFLEEDFVFAGEQATETMRGAKGGRMEGAFKKYTSNNSRPHSLAEAQDEDQTEPPPASVPAAPLPPPPNNLESTTEADHPPTAPGDTAPEIIYLTSDSPTTLTTLHPHTTYIIGGLVDKNRHKGICYRAAQARNIQTAKLPIGEFMEMQSRFVLATNHVVEIMVRWLELGDWGEAFLSVIPKRKGGRLKGKEGFDGVCDAEGEEGEGGGEGEDALGDGGDDEIVDERNGGSEDVLSAGHRSDDGGEEVLEVESSAVEAVS